MPMLFGITYVSFWHQCRCFLAIWVMPSLFHNLDKMNQICFKKKSLIFLFESKNMPKYKQRVSVPTDFVGAMIESNLTEGHNVGVFVSNPADYRIKPKAPFVILFYRALLSVIIEKKLTTTDLKVILTVLDFVKQGNVVSLTHQDVAIQAKLVRQQVTNSLRKLVDAEVLIKSKGGSLFLNPNLISKENLKDMKATEAYQIASDKKLAVAF